MAFMTPEFTGATDWLKIDGREGSVYVEISNTGLTLDEIQRFMNEAGEDEWWIHSDFDLYVHDFIPYDVDEVWAVEVHKKKFGARISASGYLDCSEWTIHNNPTAALDYLREMFVDEECLDPDLSCLYDYHDRLEMIRKMRGPTHKKTLREIQKEVRDRDKVYHVATPDGHQRY
jgi:hypothetical protein